MAKFLYNGPCSSCGSKDNVSNYDDGSSWCWGCHKYSSATVVPWTKNEEEEKTWTLPDDLSTNYPECVLAYAKKYEIQIDELLRENYLWSEKYQSLYALYFSGGTGSPTAANARTFRPVETNTIGSISKTGRSLHKSNVHRRAKYVFLGNKSDIFPVFRGNPQQREAPNRNQQTLVLTEDALSSLKIGRQMDAMPLLGTSLSMDKTKRIAGLYSRCIVWLDRDKFREAWEIATKLKWLGVSTKVVLTDKDPKEYTDSEINSLTRFDKCVIL